MTYASGKSHVDSSTGNWNPFDEISFSSRYTVGVSADPALRWACVRLLKTSYLYVDPSATEIRRRKIVPLENLQKPNKFDRSKILWKNKFARRRIFSANSQMRHVGKIRFLYFTCRVSFIRSSSHWQRIRRLMQIFSYSFSFNIFSCESADVILYLHSSMPSWPVPFGDFVRVSLNI